MAYFKQLKTKRWQVQIRKYGIKSVTKTFPTKSEAKIWANHIESEIDRGIYVSRYEAEHITFSELIHRYQKEVTPYKKSASREISRLKCLNNFFGEISLARINSEMVARFRDERLSLNLSGATVIKDLNTLSHVIDTAIKEWGCYLPSNPVKNIRKPKVNTSRSRRLSPEEEFILLAKCRRHSCAMESVVILAIETAMRLGEIINLKWSDVEIDNHVAVINESKNGEMRKIPLSETSINTLKSLAKRLGSDKVFWQWKSVSSFESSWQRVLIKSDIQDFRFHDLRHEATSRLFEMNLNMIEVSTITGHKTLQMLKRYTHLSIDKLAIKINKNRR
jgi:integrase